MIARGVCKQWIVHRERERERERESAYVGCHQLIIRRYRALHMCVKIACILSSLGSELNSIDIYVLQAVMCAGFHLGCTSVVHMHRSLQVCFLDNGSSF